MPTLWLNRKGGRAEGLGWVAALGAFVALTGCGGGMPLLYPARTLATGDLRTSGGVSGSFVVGSLANDVAAARGVAALNGNAASIDAKGALVLAAVAPGLSPYVAARVGIGNRFEGGVTYTGRAGHVDVRRSFDWNDVSLSLGFGVTIPIYQNPDASTDAVPGLELKDVNGYGFDVPVLIGWQSAARIYMVWAGVRAGWDHTNVSALTTEPGAETTDEPIPLSADRFYGGGVVGMAAGFRHVHVALELDAAYQTVNGTFNGSTATVQGFSLAPSTALWVTF